MEEKKEIEQLRRLVKILTAREIELVKAKEELEKMNKHLEELVEERTRELRETQKQLIRSAKMAAIGTMAAGIAHEINNPLGIILVNTQMLKESIRDEAKRKMLETIEKAVKRCKELTQSLLKYSRGQSVGEFKLVDVNEIMEETCRMLSPYFKKYGIEVTAKYGKLPKIMGCREELQQVFTNLLLNAVDAIKKVKRKGKIEITTCFDGKNVKISVKDNGCGIPKENIEKIFDPFFTTKKVGEGTGLGLYISLKIIENHNGTISVSSEEGKGTEFLITIPAEVGKNGKGKNTGGR